MHYIGLPESCCNTLHVTVGEMEVAPRPRRDPRLVTLPQSFKLRLGLAYTPKKAFAQALRARLDGVTDAIRAGLTVADAYHLGLDLHDIEITKELLPKLSLPCLRRLYGVQRKQLLQAVPDLTLADIGECGCSAAELVQFGFSHTTLLAQGEPTLTVADKLSDLPLGASGWYVLGFRKQDLLNSGFRRHHCTSKGWDYATVISVFSLTPTEQRKIGLQLLFGAN